MAGDWLKFEVATLDKPEVWAIAQDLSIDPDAVIGKLLRVWAWFDQQSTSGNAPSVTKALLDRCAGVSGFCNSVIKAGWMVDDGDTITLPNFERHNGKTAKTRALTGKRVKNHRDAESGPLIDDGKECNAVSVTDALPEKRREEKRREDIKDSLPVVANAPTASKNGTRLPAEWQLSRPLGEWAMQQGLTADAVRLEAENFRDYWRGVAGARGRKADWAATWRYWIRKEVRKKHRHNSKPPTAPPVGFIDMHSDRSWADGLQ